MKKFLIVLVTGLMIIPNIFSQKISKVDFQQAGSEILISYGLSGLSSGQTATVSVYVSADGGKTFTGPITEVKGDVGENVKQGRKKFIQWNALKEMPGFGGNVVFDIRALITDKTTGKEIAVQTEKEKEPEKEVKEEVEKEVKEKREKEKKEKKEITGRMFYAGLNGSNHAPLGLTVGFTKGNIGGYISGRMNTKMFTDAPYETDGLTVVDYGPEGYYIFKKGKEFKRMSVTAGMLYFPKENIGIYLGGGYARFDLLWPIEEYDYPETFKDNTYVYHNEESFTGIEMETGVLLRFNKFIVGAGASAPGLQWVEGVITLGYKLF